MWLTGKYERNVRFRRAILITTLLQRGVNVILYLRLVPVISDNVSVARLL